MTRRGRKLFPARFSHTASNHTQRKTDVLGRTLDMILLERYYDSICKDRTMVLKHAMKTLNHAAVFLMVMLASPAISKDSGILTRMLYVAFLAEQGANVCIATDPAFASETSGPMGSMRDYVKHIKAEVTAGLNETETLSLLKSAADYAKGEAQQAFRNLATEASEGPVVETARVTRWCQTVVKPLVRQVIDTHDNHHAEIDLLLEKAKKD